MGNGYFCAQTSVQNGPQPGFPSVQKMRNATSSLTGRRSMNKGKQLAPTALLARRQASIHRFASCVVPVKTKAHCSKDSLVSFLKPRKESLTSNSRWTLRTGQITGSERLG